MNSFVFETDKIRSERGFRCSLKVNPKYFRDVFSMGEILSLSVSVSFSITASSILAQGKVKAVVMAECSRCLKRFQTVLSDSFEQMYEEPGDEIDISPVLRETLAMMEPQKLVCPSECDETFLRKYALSLGGEKGPFWAIKKIDFEEKEK